MRDLLDRYGKILNESDTTSLRRRLLPELFEEIKSHQNSVIEESTLNRIDKHIKSHDCAIITAFRKQLINCRGGVDSESKLNIKNNKGRNISLKSALLYLGYGVTSVKGTYIENYMQENSVEVKEDSYFVVNLTDDPDFIKNITKLGEAFCQDSVLIFSNGGNDNYLYGTNNSDFPGYSEKIELGKYKPGLEGEFMTRVGGRPFVTETYNNLQINTKRIVKNNAESILKLIK